MGHPARARGLDEATARRLAADPERVVRTHLARALGETKTWGAWHAEVVRAALPDADPFVRRAAAEALAKHPAAENVPLLLSIVTAAAPPADPQLVHAARIALRDQLRSGDVAGRIDTPGMEPRDRDALIEVAAVTPSGPAALLIFEEAAKGNVRDDVLARALPVAARVVDATRVDAMGDFIAGRHRDDALLQISLLRGLHDGLQRRGVPTPPRMEAALTALLRPVITGEAEAGWSNRPLPGAEPSASPWVLEPRTYADGRNDVPVLSSLKRDGGGERLTGVLASPTFKLPPKLSFWMCGHNGFPDRPDARLNHVRLVLADGKEVARSYPPRDDVARPYTWDLSAHAGHRGRVEVVDATTEAAYAWLGVSRFDPPVARVPEGPIEASRADVIRLAAAMKLAGVADEVARVAGDAKADIPTRLAAAESLLSLRPAAAAAPLAAILSDAGVGAATRQSAADALGRIEDPDASAAARRVLLEQLRTAPQPVAVSIAAALAGGKDGAAALLADIRAGRASAALLREPTVINALRGAGVADLDKQVADLTARLSPADDRLGKLIADRKAAYLAGTFDPAAGRAVFAKSVCASCHKVGETGGAIGPALDGIGVRGLDRLLEDVLDPNRNVDPNFRTTIVRTKRGQTHAGFGTREEGQTLVMHDSAAKEIRVPLADVDRRVTSALSPMPANVDQLMPPQDFNLLMAFLLDQKAK